jgi:hypothetical protein
MRANGLFVIEKKPKGTSPDAPKNFSAAQKHCPPENFCFTIRYSPPFRHSLPFPDLPICRFHDLPIRFGSAGASPSTLPLYFVSKRFTAQLRQRFFGKEAA